MYFPPFPNNILIIYSHSRLAVQLECHSLIMVFAATYRAKVAARINPIRNRTGCDGLITLMYSFMRRPLSRDIVNLSLRGPRSHRQRCPLHPQTFCYT